MARDNTLKNDGTPRKTVEIKICNCMEIFKNILTFSNVTFDEKKYRDHSIFTIYEKLE